MQGPELFFISFFGALAFVVWTLVNAWLRRAQLRAANDFSLRLLERVGSFKELNEFLQTESGAAFMSNIARSATLRHNSSASHRILFASQAGIVSAAAGFGLLMLQDYLVQEQSGAVGFLICGVIALSIGLGFLVSAAVSWWLARKLGVLDPGATDRQLRDAA